MKRLILAVIVAALLAAAWLAGWAAGVNQAITCADMYITDFDPPEGGAYDLTIYIDLDGATYEHGVFIG